MKPILVWDRLKKQNEVERVYGDSALKFVYGDTLLAKVLGRTLLHLLIKTSLFAKLYGFWQKSSISKRKIVPFIEKYKVDVSEFRDPVQSFSSFNDFFVRHLKPGARPIAKESDRAVIPADGRFLFYPRIDETDGFIVKGQKLSLASLVGDQALAKEYEKGSMVMGRLCPVDYHRFHFPCDATPSESRLINGWLYSVNPVATQRCASIFSENKRTLCHLNSDQFGRVLMIEVGATCVGSIAQTYQVGKSYMRGNEKGYFSFGGSALILLFLPNKIEFDSDLVDSVGLHQEIKCQMGQSMGRAVAPK